LRQIGVVTQQNHLRSYAIPSRSAHCHPNPQRQRGTGLISASPAKQPFLFPPRATPRNTVSNDHRFLQNGWYRNWGSNKLERLIELVSDPFYFGIAELGKATKNSTRFFNDG
jgi:hypothetical protein